VAPKTYFWDTYF